MQNDHMPDGAGWYWARRPGVHAWHAEFVETVGRRFNAEGEQVCDGHLAVLEADGTQVDLGLYIWGGRLPDPPPLTARLQPERFIARTELVTRVEEALDKLRAKPASRQFVFCTGDEVDVDRIVAIDANCPGSVAHISLPAGGYIRVRFPSDEARSRQLAMLRDVRSGNVEPIMRIVAPPLLVLLDALPELNIGDAGDGTSGLPERVRDAMRQLYAMRHGLERAAKKAA